MANPTNVLWIMGARQSGRTTTLLNMLEAHGEDNSIVITPSRDQGLLLKEHAREKNITKGVYLTPLSRFNGLGKNRTFFVDGWEQLSPKIKSDLECYIHQGCRFYITHCTE